MEKITHVQAFSEGFIAHGTNRNGIKEEVHIWECRAGIVGPTGTRPGYAAFFGLRKEKNAAGNNRLIFLSELIKPLRGEFLRNVFDDVSRLRCREIFADSRKSPMEGFYSALWEYAQKRNVNIRVTPAPSADDPEYGVSLIQDALAERSIELPVNRDTVLKNQLRRMVNEDITRGDLYAFDALRFLLAGFEAYPPLTRSNFSRVEPPDPRAWT